MCRVKQRHLPPFRLGRATNRFFGLATESGDEETPTDTRCSDTESIPERMIRRRRLRLRWSPEASPVTVPVTQVGPSDSHDHKLARVGHAVQHERRLDAGQRQIRDAENFIRDVSCWVCLLMWQMVSQNAPSTTMVFFLCATDVGSCRGGQTVRSSGVDDFPGHQRPGHHQRGSFDGWMGGPPQPHAFLGVNSREDLSEWIHNQGYPLPR